MPGLFLFAEHIGSETTETRRISSPMTQLWEGTQPDETSHLIAM